VALSPAGHLVEWDAVVTKYVPHTIIAWESVRNSPVRSNGEMRFLPTPAGGTRVELKFCYEPIFTRLDDAVRAIMSPPPETQVRSDLARARFFFAHLPPAQPTLETLPGAEERRSA
jgi:uncharacterized membrane protein